jgi:hypothetical protein
MLAVAVMAMVLTAAEQLRRREAFEQRAEECRYRRDAGRRDRGR